MSEVLAALRLPINDQYLSNSCSRDGCRVSMEGVPSQRIVIDADKAFSAHGFQDKKCDYVLFFFPDTGQQLVAAPIELKSGHVDASTAADQLQQGANFAAHFVARDTHCHPILIHGKGLHDVQRRILNRTKVRFRGKNLTIKTARCDRPRNLSDALRAR